MGVSRTISIHFLATLVGLSLLGNELRYPPKWRFLKLTQLVFCEGIFQNLSSQPKKNFLVSYNWVGLVIPNIYIYIRGIWKNGSTSTTFSPFDVFPFAKPLTPSHLHDTFSWSRLRNLPRMSPRRCGTPPPPLQRWSSRSPQYRSINPLVIHSFILKHASNKKYTKMIKNVSCLYTPGQKIREHQCSLNKKSWVCFFWEPQQTFTHPSPPHWKSVELPLARHGYETSNFLPRIDLSLVRQVAAGASLCWWRTEYLKKKHKTHHHFVGEA